MAKTATRSLELEPIDRLEEKVKLLVGMVERMKSEQARAAEENQRLSRELDALRSRIASADMLAGELSSLKQERDVIRTRVTDMLEQLGFRVGWTYPKRRTLWMLDGVAVTLDVLDFGWFLELEGPAGALPDMARSFGLDPAHALKDSYSVMAKKHLKAKKLTKKPPVPVAPHAQDEKRSS